MTIDRAIEILNPEHRENYDGMEEVNEACRMGMEALEKSKWIPCSERLPDLPIDVLAVVSGTVGNIRLVNSLEIGSFHADTVDEGWILETWPEWEDPNVTYWMPLPRPPKKENGNE